MSEINQNYQRGTFPGSDFFVRLGAIAKDASDQISEIDYALRQPATSQDLQSKPDWSEFYRRIDALDERSAEIKKKFQEVPQIQNSLDAFHEAFTSMRKETNRISKHLKNFGYTPPNQSQFQLPSSPTEYFKHDTKVELDGIKEESTKTKADEDKELTKRKYIEKINHIRSSSNLNLLETNSPKSNNLDTKHVHNQTETSSTTTPKPKPKKKTSIFSLSPKTPKLEDYEVSDIDQFTKVKRHKYEVKRDHHGDLQIISMTTTPIGVLDKTETVTPSVNASGVQSSFSATPKLFTDESAMFLQRYGGGSSKSSSITKEAKVESEEGEDLAVGAVSPIRSEELTSIALWIRNQFDGLEIINSNIARVNDFLRQSDAKTITKTQFKDIIEGNEKAFILLLTKTSRIKQGWHDGQSVYVVC